MVDIDRAHALLEEIAQEIPADFWRELNGGVSLVPKAKRSPETDIPDLYVLGEYHHDSAMGRYIVLYYGSFRRVFGNLSVRRLREELRATLLHEFTHHIESLAGAYDLEIEDEARLATYRSIQLPEE